MRCPLLAIQLSSLSELMVLIMSASPLVSSSLLGNNLGLMATPWWFMAGTMCCPILAIQLRSLSELMVLIMSASPLSLPHY